MTAPIVKARGGVTWPDLKMRRPRGGHDRSATTRICYANLLTIRASGTQFPCQRNGSRWEGRSTDLLCHSPLLGDRAPPGTLKCNRADLRRGGSGLAIRSKWLGWPQQPWAGNFPRDDVTPQSCSTAMTSWPGRSTSPLFILYGVFKKLGRPGLPNRPMAGDPCKQADAYRAGRLVRRALASQRHLTAPPPA